MRSQLVGRSNELRRARFLLDEHGVVVLIGGSGVGKTALCDSLAEEWSSRGGRVDELRGTQGLQKIPFGALTAGLRVEAGSSDAETLSTVVSLLTREKGHPLIVVDDAHLLDAESAGLVAGLAQSTDVDLLLSVTSGEVVSADITSVWARWPDCLLEVEPLDREGVAALLAQLLDRSPSIEEIDEIAAISLGYPLYVTAIAHEILDSGANTVRSLLESDSFRLTRLMERRLARLEREERRLFDIVAFAESTSPQIALAGDDSVILERLVEADLVKATGSRVQVSHPLLGSVSRGTLTSEAKRQCARRLLAGIADDTEPGDVAAVVRKAIDVGVRPEVEQLRVAAHVALGWGDFPGVARITALVPDDPGLVVLRAKAARFLGETPSTEVPAGLDEAALTEYLSGASQGLAYTERRFTDAIEFLKQGMDSVVEDENRDRLAIELMVLSGLVGDIDALLGAARAVSPSADPATRLLALSATQLAEALTLATSTAEETYVRGREVADGGEVDVYLVEQLEMSRMMLELAEGRFGTAQTRARSFSDRALNGSWLTIEAVVADAWLPVAEAGDLADSAVAALATFDPLANLSQARIVADLRRAQQGLASSDEGSDLQHEPGVAEIDRIMNQRVDAWLAWSQDDSTAGKRLVEVGREAIVMGHRFWGLCALVDAVRLGHGDDAASDIEHLVITRGAGLAVLASRFARARTPVELSAAARMWWEAGAPVYGIESAIRAATESEDPTDAVAVHLMATVGADPLVGDLQSVPNPLSKRQLEVVAGAIHGSSNEEIANRLFISRRTVENHLHRVYSTLRLAGGRDDLRERFEWIA